MTTDKANLLELLKLSCACNDGLCNHCSALERAINALPEAAPNEQALREALSSIAATAAHPELYDSPENALMDIEEDARKALR